MKFNKKEYYTLKEAITQHGTLWSKCNNVLFSLNEELKDLDDNNQIEIINEFFDKEIISLDKLDVLITVTNESLENIMESKLIERHTNDYINYHVYDNDKEQYYIYNSFLKQEKLVIEQKHNYLV
jgi:hypothetical protein